MLNSYQLKCLYEKGRFREKLNVIEHGSVRNTDLKSISQQLQEMCVMEGRAKFVI